MLHHLCSLGKPRSVTCEALLQWDVLCLTNLCALNTRQALGCSTAPQRRILATRQSSIITATAPPASAVAVNVKIKPVVFTTSVVVPFIFLDQSLRHSRWLCVLVHRWNQGGPTAPVCSKAQRIGWSHHARFRVTIAALTGVV